MPFFSECDCGMDDCSLCQLAEANRQRAEGERLLTEAQSLHIEARQMVQRFTGQQVTVSPTPMYPLTDDDSRFLSTMKISWMGDKRGL